MEKTFHKIFLVLFSLLFFVTPLVMFNKTSEIFEFNKLMFIYLVAILAASYWIVSMILHNKIIINKSRFSMVVVLFILSQIFATVFSIDVHTSIFGYYGRFNGGLLSILSYFVLYMAFITFLKKDDIWLFIKVSLSSSVIVIFWGLLAKMGFDLTCLLFTGHRDNSCWTEQFKPVERMFATIGQPNWLGTYLLINFFLGLYFLFAAKSKIKALLISIYLALNFSAILFTRSRSSLLAFVASYALFTIYIIFMRRQFIKKTLSLSVVFIILILVLKTGIAKIDNLLIIKQDSHSTKIVTKPSQENITDSADLRRIVWQGAFNLGLKYPLFGTGVETFGYSYYQVRPLEHNLTSEWDFIYNKAHNEYLNYFATTGSFGLGTYMIMIISVLILLERYLKAKLKHSDEDYKLVAICIYLAYVSILITNFFGFSTTVTNIFFYLLPALIIVLAQSDKPTESNNKQHKLLFTSKIKKLLILNCFLTLFFLFMLGRYYLADVNFAWAEKYNDIDEYVKSYEYLIKAKSLKNDHVYDDRLSSVLTNLAFIISDDKKQKKEINTLIKLADYYNLSALKASPQNPQYWKSRSQNNFVFYNINKEEKYFKAAIESLRKAQLLAPTDPKIPYIMANYFYLRAKNEKKETIKSKYINLAIGRIEMAIRLKKDYKEALQIKDQLLKK